jgi:hypothetical protein
LVISIIGEGGLRAPRPVIGEGVFAHHILSSPVTLGYTPSPHRLPAPPAGFAGGRFSTHAPRSTLVVTPCATLSRFPRRPFSRPRPRLVSRPVVPRLRSQPGGRPTVPPAGRPSAHFPVAPPPAHGLVCWPVPLRLRALAPSPGLPANRPVLLALPDRSAARPKGRLAARPRLRPPAGLPGFLCPFASRTGRPSARATSVLNTAGRYAPLRPLLFHAAR